MDFFVNQFNQIRKGGRPAFFQRIWNLTGLLLAVVPVVLIRLLRPFVLIRLGRLESRRIGHFISDPEFYLSEKECGMQPLRTIDIFCYAAWICNKQIKKMCDRALHTTRVFRHMYRVNQLLPGGKPHTISIITAERHNSRDVLGLLRKTPVHLKLTAQEEKRGMRELQAFGVPEGGPFVCFHARDSVYLNTVMPGFDFSYHDYRDSEILNYLQAAEELTRRGYFVFRMGAHIGKKLPTGNPMIIDYASHWRTDFMDIYLAAKCRFFLGCSSGIDFVATIYRRPIAYVNVLPFELVPSWGPEDLFIPKKLRLIRENRFMSFQEILTSGAGKFSSTQDYSRRGIQVVENSPNEIADLTTEMDERLKGTWNILEEDKELQKRFWSLFKFSKVHGEILSPVGAVFLRQNRQLLESNP
ncbi:MAG: TIGR04372 family glycosyltransferase [Elusimicrobia bacterium]|nr:TIGR04372 family glycosyltransferase [Elusimicrobiota bacterium]